MSLILSIITFSLFIFLSIYLLGKMIINILKIKISFWEELVIGINIGIVLYTIFIFTLWRLNLYSISFFIPILPLLYFTHRFRLMNFRGLKVRFNLRLAVIILICTLIPSLMSIKSGDITNDGLRMIGANAHDTLSYFALINSLQKNVPPENPTFSGEEIKNYHYLSYVFFSAVQYITKIPLLVLYFKILIPFLSFLFAASIYIFVKNLTKSNFLGYITVIFTSLSSNMYYFPKFLYPNALFSPSVLWIDEYATRMVNPQLLLSYIIMLTIFYLLLKVDLNKVNNKTILSLLIGSLLLFKAFSGILVFIAIGLLALYKLIKGAYQYLILTLLSSFVASLLYVSSNSVLSSTFIFSPLWFIKNIFESSDHLNFSQWELKRQTFLSDGNYIRISLLYLEGVLIFLLGNLGVKFLGFFQSFKRLEKVNEVIISLLFIIAFGLILPQLFLVRGTAWNSIQFSYYSVFVLGLLTPIALYQFLGKHKSFFLLILLLNWTFLLPGVYQATNNYFISPSRNDIFPKNIYQATLFLKNQKDGVVLIDPQFFNDTFIPAFSSKTSFFADEMWLSVLTTPFAKRKEDNIRFFQEPDITWNTDFLKTNRIKYIFANSDKEMSLNELSLEKIFQNESITIFKTNE